MRNIKKKMLLIILICVLAVCSIFGLAACDLNDLFGGSDDSGATSDTNATGGGDTSATNDNSGNASGNGNTTGGNGTGNAGNSGDSTPEGSSPHVCTFVYSSTVAPDCENRGYDVYACTCGKTEYRNYTNALGHDYVWTVHNATCTTDWSQTGVCSRCGDTDVQTVPDSKRHTYGTYVYNNDATCTSDGTETAECTLCGATDTRTATGTMLSHSLTYVSGNAATCQTTGNTAYYVCTDCNKWFSDSQGHLEISDKTSVVIEKAAHNYSNNVCTVCGAHNATVGLEYKDMGTYYTVVGLGTVTHTDIVIPDTYNGKPVRKFGLTFNHNTDITSIVIPDSVIGIMPDAFFGCSNLNSVTIGNGVTEIGEGAFGSCTSLVNVTFGNSVEIIGGQAFANTALTSITLPNSVTYISRGAFAACNNLMTVNIPAGVTYMGALAFENTKTIQTVNGVKYVGNWAVGYDEGITYVTLKSGTVGIAGNAFKGCTTLISVVIPNGVRYIADEAFRDCTALQSVVVPNSVTQIHSQVFLNCSNLISVNIPNGITEISDYLFNLCSSLTSIVIPASVTTIAHCAFWRCSALMDITFNGTKAQWNAIEKGYGWNDSAGNFTVHCIDGDI